MLGISADPLKDLLSWKEKEKLPYDLLSDADHQVLEAWGAWGEKVKYGKKYMGIIRSHWTIDENGVLIDQKIKISPEDSIQKGIEAVS